MAEDEHSKQIEILLTYCLEGGDQRAGKRFIEKERAYNKYQFLLKDLKTKVEGARQSNEWYVYPVSRIVDNVILNPASLLLSQSQNRTMHPPYVQVVEL